MAKVIKVFGGCNPFNQIGCKSKINRAVEKTSLGRINESRVSQQNLECVLLPYLCLAFLYNLLSTLYVVNCATNFIRNELLQNLFSLSLRTVSKDIS